MSEPIPDSFFCAFHTGETDWKAAVRRACCPLAEAGLVPEAFTESILSSVDRYGPHFIPAPGIALPCPAEAFVPAASAALSLLVTAPPVIFDPDDAACYADLFLVVAAPDRETGQRLTATLARRLREGNTADRLREAAREGAWTRAADIVRDLLA
jgi:PTS system ascorbate-specific IIA component